MPNIKLLVEYDGSFFHGWQEQPGLRTVQGELRRVLSLVLREEIAYVLASGRTDCGVHARGQVVNFHLAELPDLMRLKHSVSNILKGQLAVLDATVVSDDFHATRSAKQKQYGYTIINRAAPLVLDYGKAWQVAYPLNLELMREAAACLVGQHDFSSFRGSGCNSSTPIKQIYSSNILVSDPVITYQVVGSGFLKQMVRIIVGTLVDIGRGRLVDMPNILASKNRQNAGITAPAQGLFLDWVQY